MEKCERNGGENSRKSDVSKRSRKKEPVVAPGFDDERFGENATEEDIKNGNYTKVTRVFFD